MRILVADKLAKEGLEFLHASGVAYDEKVGLKEDELAAAVPAYDALIVRSGAKVTAKVLESPGSLKVIARAGVGVDNIDLDAATAKGILVLNTAEASTLSTAEHALALMMSLARKIPQAHASLRSGQLEWKKRSVYQGTQLAGKTLGVVGLGRIGRTVASRALALEMNVLAYDPYFSAPTALDGKVEVVRDFDAFLARLDVITFHVPGGDGTRHLLNRDRLFTKARPNLLVVNDSRGEVVDEFALAEALKAKKIAGAALDVYATEPPAQDHPLFGLENAVLTPHLGASTDEAQTAVSVEACKAIVAYLQGGQIRGAVNAVGIRLDLARDEQPFADLARRMAVLLGAFCKAGVRKIRLQGSGKRPPKILETLLRLAAVELLKPHLAPPVNVINVRSLAEHLKIELEAVHESTPPPYEHMAGDIVSLRIFGCDGESHRIMGTVYDDELPRVRRIDNFALDMIPSGQMVLIQNNDRPGVIGIVGSMFGEHGVNIADMTLSRAEEKDGPRALMVLKVDSAPPAALVNTLRARPNILMVEPVSVPAPLA